jgi:REP element-mobilizing transposase RayT
MLLPKIIGRFKMNSAKQINQIRNTSGIPVWQRNYYEHIIRNEKSLENIRNYIINNPSKWYYDNYNTKESEI